jgi:hypothetical protein
MGLRGSTVSIHGSRMGLQPEEDPPWLKDELPKLQDHPSFHTVVKAGGIFLFPRIFPSYFM